MSEHVKAYGGITVTLAAGANSLLDLLRAIDDTCPAACRELNIQSRAANLTSVNIGDSLVSANRAGIELGGGDSQHYGGGAATREIYISNIHFYSAAGGELINVEIQN